MADISPVVHGGLRPEELAALDMTSSTIEPA